jgi:ABC-type polysaccharide/polyol phosphate export permease
VHLALHFGSNYLRKYYLDTYLGLLWIPLLPVLDILVRTLVFGGFLGVPSGNRPYLVFLLVGSIGWYFFDRTTLWSYRSLQVNRRYFHTVPAPWLPAITGAAIPGAVQAGLYGLIALVVSIYYKLSDGSFYVGFGGHTAYAALGLVLLLLYSWTFGLLLAPLVRVIRDTRLVLRYFFAFLYMVTPILYTVQAIPPRYRSIALYNPLTAPVEFVRHGLLEMGMPDARSIVTSVVVLVAALPIAALLFAGAERAAHSRL